MDCPTVTIEIKAKVEKISQLTWPPGQYLAHVSYFGLLTKVHASSRELTRATLAHASMITLTGVYKKQERKQIVKLVLSES